VGEGCEIIKKKASGPENGVGWDAGKTFTEIRSWMPEARVKKGKEEEENFPPAGEFR